MHEVWYATLIKRPGLAGRVVEWAINNHCNLRCLHCYMEDEEMKHKQKVRRETKLSIANRIADVAKSVIVSGGEPLLDKDLFAALDVLTSRGCDVALITNGTVFDDDTVAKIRASGVKAVQISIDSHEQGRHDAFRVIQGSWAKSVAALEELLASGIRVAIAHTVHARNYRDAGKMIDFAARLGVPRVYVLKFLPCGEGERNREYMLTVEQEKELVLDILRPSVASSRVQVMTSAPEWNLLLGNSGEGSIGCSHGQIMFVNFTGDVYSCPMVDKKVGTILEQDLVQIYRSPEMARFRDRSELSGGDCAICPHLTQCGGCYAAAGNTIGDIFKRGECWVYRDVISQPEAAKTYLPSSLSAVPGGGG